MAASNKFQLPSLQELQSSEQMELLNIVDSLRAQGLSEFTALPQLIVCGDQSSGKSSLLEAISGIPFPRQENLCTRFATEVILRRASSDTISVSIVPGSDRTSEDRDRLLLFRHELTSRNDFPGLFDKAKDAMGLSSGDKSFSNDLLRVEICGPSQPQLTLVDLPGLIHSHGKSQSPSDVSLVHNLVSHYISNPRSIILAVISAKYDYNNQIIIRRARTVDPKGSRVLGIITKPDTLTRGSDSEQTYIALARNEEVKFDLGWHVVKNLDSSVHNAEQVSRDDQETQFFKESKFSCLPSHTVGIHSLRSRLSKVLFSQIRVELPRLVVDIESQLTIAKNTRDKLGPSRSSTHEQRSFLNLLSQSFQTICRDAVRGDYDHEFFQVDANPERRLCANLMNMHFNFARNMRRSGASWIVESDECDESDESDLEDDTLEEEVLEEDNKFSYIKRRTREEAIEEASKLLKRSRGRELPGLPNPLLVGELFREYSHPWEGHAKRHIRNVWESTNRFLELVLKYLTDEEASDKILRYWIYPIMEQRLEAAYKKLDELLEVHKEHPMTTNPIFLNNRKKPQQMNSKNEFEERLQKEFKKPDQKMTLDEINRILSSLDQKPTVDMDMAAAEEAFDNMNAFYEVAINLFLDNVPTLAIQTPIVREVPKIFCPAAVFDMDHELRKKVAGESVEKATERESILRKIEILKQGVTICSQYSRRAQASATYPPQELYSEEKSDSEQREPENTTTTHIQAGIASGKQKQNTVKLAQRSKPQETGAALFPSVPAASIYENPFAHLATHSPFGGSRSQSPNPNKDSPAPFGASKGFKFAATPIVTNTSPGLAPAADKGSKSSSSTLFSSSGGASKPLFSNLSPSSTEAKKGQGNPGESPKDPEDTSTMRPQLKSDMLTLGLFTPFDYFLDREPGTTDSWLHFQSITAQFSFQKYSVEELRLADYQWLEFEKRSVSRQKVVSKVERKC